MGSGRCLVFRESDKHGISKNMNIKFSYSNKTKINEKKHLTTVKKNDLADLASCLYICVNVFVILSSAVEVCVCIVGYYFHWFDFFYFIGSFC